MHVSPAIPSTRTLRDFPQAICIHSTSLLHVISCSVLFGYGSFVSWLTLGNLVYVLLVWKSASIQYLFEVSAICPSRDTVLGTSQTQASKLQLLLLNVFLSTCWSNSVHFGWTHCSYILLPYSEVHRKNPVGGCEMSFTTLPFP